MSRRTKWYLGQQSFEAAAAPFLQAGVLEAVDIYTVDTLARLAGVQDAEVLLGLAFAVRAPRFGHVGVELDSIDAQVGLEQAAALPWPPRPGWLDKVAACESLVDRWPEGKRPFVALGADALPCGHGRAVRLLTRRFFHLEQAAAGALAALLKGPGRLSRSAAAQLADLALERLLGDQPPLMQALINSLSSRLSLITGGPGSGKTFAIKFLLYAHWLAAAGSKPPRVALAAPTGKAARRLKQALLEGLAEAVPRAEARAWIEGLEPVTVHRLLGAARALPGRFEFGAENPLPCELLVVDEASMVDLFLLVSLLRALPAEGPGPSLVLVGDPGQLASVEAGCVLADLCSGLPPERVVHLRTQYRTSRDSPLRLLAERLAGGEAEEALSLLSGGGSELRLWPLAEERLSPPALNLLWQGYGDYLEAARREDVGALLAALERFCVLTPYRSGEMGVAGLNERLEDLFRQRAGRGGWFEPANTWYLGRPVLMEANNHQLGLMNGDLGVVVPTPNGPRVAFRDDQADGRPMFVHPELLPDCRTAFAMTVHKAQGSQFDEVALVLPPRDTSLLTRELIYTAATRARRGLVVIGCPDTLRRALSRRLRRASGLGYLLARHP